MGSGEAARAACATGAAGGGADGAAGGGADGAADGTMEIMMGLSNQELNSLREDFSVNVRLLKPWPHVLHT